MQIIWCKWLETFPFLERIFNTKKQYTVLHEISVSVPGATKLVLIIWICWYSVYHFVSLNMLHTSKT